MMEDKIKTYILFDLETTGLPAYESNLTKIIELSMVAVKRIHLNEDKIPRVQNKISLCFQPRKTIRSSVHGLSNDLLEFEDVFDENAFNLLSAFLNKLQKPACLIAHNGIAFDYPILQQHLHKLEKKFPDDLFCADSLLAFRQIYNNPELFLEDKCEEPDEIEKIEEEIKECIDILLNSEENLKTNESNSQSEEEVLILWEKHEPSTPIQNTKNQIEWRKNLPPNLKRKAKENHLSRDKVRKKLFDSKPPSFKLMDLYKHLTNKPPINSHQSEVDCYMMLECMIKQREIFLKWVDKNAQPFNKINRLY